MMVIFHLAFDLQYFYHWNIDTAVGAWRIFERVTAHLFLFVVGASFAVSWSHTPCYNKYLRRGLMLLGWGMVISIVTYVMDPATFIRFGVLHLIGVSILLLPLFAKFKEWNAVIALVFLTGWLSNDWDLPHLLLPIFPTVFDSLDYFPLFPWFGTVLLGYVAGYVIYTRLHWHWTISSPALEKLSWPGKHSLIIYLVHQPMIFALLKIILG